MSHHSSHNASKYVMSMVDLMNGMMAEIKEQFARSAGKRADAWQ
jgi:hypothetical protein